jgi:predicted O-methyltransferase YrrM
MFNARIRKVIDQVDLLRHKVVDHWQIPRDEAEILAQIVRIGRCRSICEIGASYGFSTLHLAAATAEADGWMHSFEISEKKIAATAEHLRQAGLLDRVTLHLGDARETVAKTKPQRPYDFAFIDAVKEQSLEYLKALQSHLAPHAVIVTDNTQTHAKELASFVKHLRGIRGASSCPVMVGNGFELTVLA